MKMTRSSVTSGFGESHQANALETDKQGDPTFIEEVQAPDPVRVGFPMNFEFLEGLLQLHLAEDLFVLVDDAAVDPQVGQVVPLHCEQALLGEDLEVQVDVVGQELPVRLTQRGRLRLELRLDRVGEAVLGVLG